MPFDKLKYPKELREERLKAVQESLETLSKDDIQKIVKEHQDELTDEWRAEFLRHFTEPPQSTVYRAVPQKDLVVYYRRDPDFGVWVQASGAMGPLDDGSKHIMNEAIESSFSGRKVGENK
jgi:hypothetical protein